MHHEWRKLRADQLREQARRDAIVIVPVAALEQHGPHLPVEVDSILGEDASPLQRTAVKVLAKGQPVLVLPVIWTGLSEHHMSFGGTVTLDNAVFAGLIEGGRITVEFCGNGFLRRVALLNAHGGNENALRSITDDLTPKLGVPIVQFTYWYAAAVAIAKILETQGGLQHACEAETSMMMAICPDLVAVDRIPLAKANTTPDVSAIAGGGVYMWRRHWQPIGLRRDRQPRGRNPGKGRIAVRRDFLRARRQAVQSGALGIALDVGDRAELNDPPRIRVGIGNIALYSLSGRRGQYRALGGRCA